MVKTNHEVKVSRKNSKGTDSVNFKIEVDGKSLNISINGKYNFMIIHKHGTTINDLTFGPSMHVKIDTCDEDGEIYSLALNEEES